MMEPGRPKHDAAAAACRNAAIELEEMAAQLRAKCLHAFSEPAEVPVEAVLALHAIEDASRNLHAAAEEYYGGPDEETIEAMRRIRRQAARDAAERETRRKRND